MQCACVTLAEKFREGLNLFCTFTSGHWIRANIQCGHRRVVCLFKQETPEGSDGHCGNEVGTQRRDIEIYPDSQPVTYTGTQPQ